MKEQFLLIDRLLTTDQDDYDDFEPIPTTTAAMITTTKRNDVTSYDSAFFSGGTGSSWSDMVEEDEEEQRHQFDNKSPHSPSLSHYDDEDTDMFVHSGEKESWWL